MLPGSAPDTTENDQTLNADAAEGGKSRSGVQTLKEFGERKRGLAVHQGRSTKQDIWLFKKSNILSFNLIHVFFVPFAIVII